jgi:hypothetical protein
MLPSRANRESRRAPRAMPATAALQRRTPADSGATRAWRNTDAVRITTVETTGTPQGHRLDQHQALGFGGRREHDRSAAR